MLVTNGGAFIPEEWCRLRKWQWTQHCCSPDSTWQSFCRAVLLAGLNSDGGNCTKEKRLRSAVQFLAELLNWAFPAEFSVAKLFKGNYWLSAFAKSMFLWGYDVSFGSWSKAKLTCRIYSQEQEGWCDRRSCVLMHPLFLMIVRFILLVLFIWNHWNRGS